MSKIIKNLKNLEDNRTKAPLPPNLMGVERDSKKRKFDTKVIILAIIFFVVLLGTGLFFLLTGEEDNEEKNTVAKAIPKKNIQSTIPTVPVENQEPNESEYIIPDENMVIPHPQIEEETTSHEETTSEETVIKTEPKPLKISNKKIETTKITESTKPKKIKSEKVKTVKKAEPKKVVKKVAKTQAKPTKAAKPSTSKPKTEVAKATIPKTESTVPILTPKEREQKFSEYVMKGDEAFLVGNTKEAIKWYEKALYLKNDIGVLNNLLSLYIQAGKPDLILKVFDTEPPPITNENIISGLVIEMIKKGYTKQAKAIIEKTIKYDKNGYLLYAKGFLYEKQKNPILAFKYYELAYEKNKYDPYIIYKYAEFLESREEYEKAEKLYRKILSISTDMALNKKVEKKLKKLYKNL